MSGQQRAQSADAAPTSFFDGSYSSIYRDSPQDTPAPSSSLSSVWRGVFTYSAPHWSYVYNATLVVLDALMTLTATIIVMGAHKPSQSFLFMDQFPANDTVCIAGMFAATWLISLAGTQIYTRHTMGEGYELYSKIIGAIFIDFIALCTIIYIFSLSIPRTVVVAVPLLSGVLTLFERWLMRGLLRRNRALGKYNYATVIVGSPDAIHDVIRQLDATTALGYAPFAICPVSTSTPTSSHDARQRLVQVPFIPLDDRERALRVLPLNSHLPQTAKDLGARTMLITDVMSRHSETMRTLSLAMESMGIELAFSAEVADIDGAALHLRDNPAMPVFTATLPQYSTRTRIVKRVMDIIGSLLALIISSPVMAVVALLVRAEDGGPAIYKQQRIGLYGKTFTLYKFRSMHVNADKIDAQLAKEMGENHGILFKPKDDPRITRIGRFIRKTSLDEFPQFLNVLIGNMSLVGPRPQQQYEVDEYASLYSTRLLVKPGITGLWQVSGRSDLSQEESERLDVSYVERWSINGDIAILLKTITAVIRGIGSY